MMKYFKQNNDLMESLYEFRAKTFKGIRLGVKLYILEWYAICWNVLKWKSSFWSARTQGMILEGEYSSAVLAVSGVQ